MWLFLWSIYISFYIYFVIFHHAFHFPKWQTLEGRYSLSISTQPEIIHYTQHNIMIIVIIIHRYHKAFVWTGLVETCINSIHCRIIIISWAYRYISLFDGTTAVTRCLLYIIIIWILACNGLWRHRQRRDGSKLCCTLVRATRRESWYLTPSRVKSRPSLFFFSFFFPSVWLTIESRARHYCLSSKI